ncbi:hypothetical protein B0H21DRAFT_739606 [Amylocystis lapponica]|nr:hypothetical protein B0H21DRAFT_739606 [Amylocystis lapponica]
MPRLFPNIGRSSKENARADYAHFEGYNPGYGQPDYGYGHDERGYEPEPRNQPAWRRMLTKKPRQHERTYYGEEEGIHRNRSYRATVEDYPEDHLPELGLQRRPMSGDTESFVEIGRSDSPIPLVQRESSLTRLQEAFADHGTFAPATSTATGTMRGTPRYSPRVMAGPVEMGTMHETRHEPVFVDSPPREAVRPDVRHVAGHRRERLPHSQNVFPGSNSPTILWDGAPPSEEYPPVVLVVEHGKRGKKDTYYIIPGGAPVVFEDEDGNELTRVGDFSGRYRPRRPRPVIVQDQYGREICRAGFNDDRTSSRSDDSLYDNDPSSSRGRSSYREHRYDGHRDERSHRSNADMSYEHGRPRPPPNVVHIDPYSQRSTGRSSNGSSGSPRHYDDRHRYEDYSSRSFDQVSSNASVIHLDDHRPQRRHGSSGSSRSGGSSGQGGYRVYPPR